MRDSRIDNLARVLVRYSTEVRPGEIVNVIGDAAGEPLVVAIYEEVLRAGAHPMVYLSPDGMQSTFFALANDEQLGFLHPVAAWNAEHEDVRIVVTAPVNTRDLSSVPAEKQALVQRSRRPIMETVMRRSAANEMRWSVTAYPTHMLAAEAEMSLAEYERLYFGACLADQDDPIAAWKRQSEETKRLADWISGRDEVHITGPGTDLRMSIAGRTFVAGNGTCNMPDGEFFTGPVEDSAEGHITFHLPAVHNGRDVSGVRLEFRGGKVVGATAEKNEDYLITLLDTDPGARLLGELGIGTNYGLEQGTRSILLDEKIGGTIHLAVGQSYPETGGVNESAVHWDMICDLRKGGRITVDGELMQEDGAFVV